MNVVVDPVNGNDTSTNGPFKTLSKRMHILYSVLYYLFFFFAVFTKYGGPSSSHIDLLNVTLNPGMLPLSSYLTLFESSSNISSIQFIASIPLQATIGPFSNLFTSINLFSFNSVVFNQVQIAQAEPNSFGIVLNGVTNASFIGCSMHDMSKPTLASSLVILLVQMVRAVLSI